ncbi:hypothetical protein GCM10023149_37570 [Mucilaginibacter gynuensis]|uniref:RHS repeat-associated core domain-containing protein n=1 Tax=Mucilaginibacter gynuensis TaxID=1302236 RepID=A0ABP8GYZ4_9SPHI
MIYNNFDLPATVTFSDGRSVTYQYDGVGNKLTMTAVSGGSTTTIDYVGAVQYEQGQLSLIFTDEGVARKNGTNYRYQYILTDHLGNARVVIQPEYPNETVASVLQINNYYPFGLRMGSNDASILIGYSGGDNNRYQFNGKEIQEVTNTYDFGARYYDPATGRWSAPDPASQFAEHSPYAAMGNNPMARIDPDGRWHILVGALVGGIGNLAIHAMQGKVKSFKDGFAAFGIGAVAGAVTAATFGTGSALVGGTSAVSAIANSAATGAVMGATGSTIQGVGNALYFGDSFGPQDVLTGAITGGVVGAAAKGIQIAIASKSAFVTANGVKQGAPSQTELDDAQAINDAFRQEADDIANGGVKFTSNNYRSNLAASTGINPADAHAHHVFSQKFSAEFLRRGININDPKYLTWWNATNHLQSARAYNMAWETFLRSNPTRSQILTFGRELMSNFGQTVRY